MTQQPTYGPHNPHPLSTLRTELVWEGKYDEYGQRREVDIAGCAMLMQKIESIDEPRREAEAKKQLSLFEAENKRQDDFRNRLIWGDNKLVMASLLQEFKGKVDLIYIDPPFDVGADFTMQVQIGDEKEEIGKDQSTLEMVAYRDMWGKGTDSYLHMIYERLSLMKELLSQNGSIYVYCDYRVNGYIRLILDDLFGLENHLNEIIWCFSQGAKSKRMFGRKHNTIYSYSKFPGYQVFNTEDVRTEMKSGKSSFGGRLETDEDGRQYRLVYGTKNTQGETKYYKYYLDEGKIPEDYWTDINSLQSGVSERVDYPTQKPEALTRSHHSSLIQRRRSGCRSILWVGNYRSGCRAAGAQVVDV